MEPQDYLLDIEKDKLMAASKDPVFMNALRKVLLEPVYQHGVLDKGESNPTKNFALTPAFNMLLQKREMWDFEKLGLHTMSSAMAVQMIEQGLGVMEGLSPEVVDKKPKKNLNPR